MHLVTLKDFFPLNFSSLSLIQCKLLASTISLGKKLYKCNKHCVKYHLLLLFVLKMVVVNCIWHSLIFVLGDLKSSHTLLPCLCSACFCDSLSVLPLSHTDWLFTWVSSRLVLQMPFHAMLYKKLDLWVDPWHQNSKDYFRIVSLVFYSMLFGLARKAWMHKLNAITAVEPSKQRRRGILRCMSYCI